VNVKTKLSDRLRPLLLGAALLAATAQAQVRPLDRVVAIVDNDVVMQSQLDARLREVQQTIDKRGGALPPENVLSQQVLERLIIENIQLQIGERSGIRITDEELNQAMSTIAQRNGMSLEQFREALARDGLSYADARDQVRREMIISRVRQRRVAERIQVTDQEVQNFLASDLGKMASAAEYNLGHILIAVPSEASPADLQAAAKKAEMLVKKLRNGADFRQMAIAESSGRTALDGGDLGWRKEAQLPGIFAPVAPKLQVGGISDPIKSASGYHIIKLKDKRGGNTQLITQTKTRHILIRTNEVRDQQQAEELINQLYQRLQAGEDFAALAQEFSDDPGSGASGGDLGWVNPGDMVPEFDATMQQTGAGKISAPFESQFGWHILQVEDRRQTDVGAENQRNQVRQMLYGRRFEEELPIWLRKIRSEAYVDIKERP